MIKEQIDINQSNKALWISGIVIGIFVIALITNGFGLFSNNGNSNQISQGSIPLSIGESPVLGDENAPITIYTFSDFSCPYCAAAAGQNQEVIAQLKSSSPSWEAPIPNIIEDYVNTGEVKIVFKYSSGHGTGAPAHIVSLALYDQDPKLFWEFHDLAFANQKDVSSLDKMKSLAKELGADMDKLNEDIKNNNYNSQLQAEDAMGASNKVDGTPTFFVNGKKVSGAQSYSVFKNIIDQELNN